MAPDNLVVSKFDKSCSYYSENFHANQSYNKEKLDTFGSVQEVVTLKDMFPFVQLSIVSYKLNNTNYLLSSWWFWLRKGQSYLVQYFYPYNIKKTLH